MSDLFTQLQCSSDGWSKLAAAQRFEAEADSRCVLVFASGSTRVERVLAATTTHLHVVQSLAEMGLQGEPC